MPLTDGAFALSFSVPPLQTLNFVARDAVGNESEFRIAVSVLPRFPETPVRGVHVSARAWSNAELRNEILQLVDEGLINTVELDLKDELGEIGYDSQVELGREIGATRAYYDLADAVALLHAKDVRVIGRLVAFRDPILADWAWSQGRPGARRSDPRRTALRRLRRLLEPGERARARVQRRHRRGGGPRRR